MSQGPQTLILHVAAAPDAWNVPAREPASLAAFLVLQLAVPGRFVVARASSPDASPSGITARASPCVLIAED
jgi:hypothetical protein